MEKYEIVKFEDCELSIDVKVSPNENTVWLTQDEIAILFKKSRSTITEHINNIFTEGELEQMTSVGISDRSNHRPAKLYNLDVVLAVGYRVKSQNGIVFRRWANSVLKEYLLKGYVINESRTLVTNENYVNLIYKVEGVLEKKVDELDTRLTKIEESHVVEREKVFFDGDLFDTRAFLKNLFVKAEKTIAIIDPYADILALDYLKAKGNGVATILCISSKAKLSAQDISAFNAQYGGLTIKINNSFHDRFLIIDEKDCYSIGAYLNYAGKRTFAIIKIENGDIIDSLMKKIIN